MLITFFNNFSRGSKHIFSPIAAELPIRIQFNDGIRIQFSVVSGTSVGSGIRIFFAGRNRTLSLLGVSNLLSQSSDQDSVNLNPDPQLWLVGRPTAYCVTQIEGTRSDIWFRVEIDVIRTRLLRKPGFRTDKIRIGYDIYNMIKFKLFCLSTFNYTHCWTQSDPDDSDLIQNRDR